MFLSTSKRYDALHQKHAQLFRHRPWVLEGGVLPCGTWGTPLGEGTASCARKKLESVSCSGQARAFEVQAAASAKLRVFVKLHGMARGGQNKG